MTLKEFFRQARKRKWSINAHGAVRCARGDCPLVALAHCWAPSIAASALGLRIATARKIANAADDPDDRNRKWLQKNLRVRL